MDIITGFIIKKVVDIANESKNSVNNAPTQNAAYMNGDNNTGLYFVPRRPGGSVVDINNPSPKSDFEIACRKYMKSAVETTVKAVDSYRGFRDEVINTGSEACRHKDELLKDLFSAFLG